jgi:hypothetical protein
LILDFGIENFRNTLMNLIMIRGLGALKMERELTRGTRPSISNTCRITDTHKKNTMLASNWHQWSLRYGTSPCEQSQALLVLLSVIRRYTIVHHSYLATACLASPK